MPYLRAASIGLALIFFFVVVAPIQWLAIRYRWPLRFQIPLFFGRTLVALLRVKVKTHSALASPRPRVLVANHVSWLDILIFVSHEPFCFLAKQEVARWPMIATFARLQQTVFVERRKGRGLLEANESLCEQMKAGRSILLFPEGTTTDGDGLVKFRSSHFAIVEEFQTVDRESSATIQPAAITYSSSEVAWYGDMDLVSHIWSLLKGPPLRCNLIFGEPHVLANGANRKAIAQDMEEAINALLTGVKDTNGEQPTASGESFRIQTS
jgi:1-acyl-sn-glycerol-3-phosphate acyltransferase